MGNLRKSRVVVAMGLMVVGLWGYSVHAGATVSHSHGRTGTASGQGALLANAQVTSEEPTGAAPEATPPESAQSADEAPKGESSSEIQGKEAGGRSEGKAEGKAEGDDGPPYEAVSQSPKAPAFKSAPGAVVVVAQMKGTVDLGVAPYLERALELAKEQRAVLFVLEMNTPGGRVDAALKIRDILLDAEVPTIVWIHREAISAGALIALAHDFILWSSASTMGAATPIQLAGGEAEPVDEKMTSFMRSAMRATAEAKGRDGKVAEAMVDKDISLPPHAGKGWLLTVAHSQAQDLGLWDGNAESLEEVLAWAGLEGAQVLRPEENWAESVARFLTDPVVSSILMSVGVLGIIIEFYTPGFGFAGIVGLLSLLLFFAGHMVVMLVGWEEVALFVVGAALLAVEILIIPGFGVAGVAGAAAIIASLLLALVGVEFSVALDLGIAGKALFQVMASLATAGVLFVLLLRYLPSTRPMKRLILSLPFGAEDGVVALPQGLHEAEILGQEGLTLTHCRPVGKASLVGRKIDVSSEGEVIPKGTRVRVIKVEGPRIVVRVVPPEMQETTLRPSAEQG